MTKVWWLAKTSLVHGAVQGLERSQPLPFIADVKAGTDGDEDNKIQLNQATMQAGLDLELRLGSDPHESSTRSSPREFL